MGREAPPMNEVRMLSVVNRTVGRGWFPGHRNSLQTCRRCIVAEAFASGTCENELRKAPRPRAF